MIGEIDKCWSDRNFKVIGVDEAGRGPLCGPVVTAAVSLINEIPGLDDSKKLTKKKREELFPLVIQNSIWSVFSVRTAIIDELNILHATMFGMSKCINRVLKKISGESVVLIDGNRVTGRFDNEKCLVKGDSKSVNIAAASILAKVHRDRIMERWGTIYPQYNFSSHKGYATAEHYELIKKFGPCEIHRKSFKLYKEKMPEQTTLF
jgi:ribonuclease HII